MANSINTNIAAYYAQANISLASRLASDSVARLSSGNRIVRASDDVTALSIGTALQTSVSTLRTALLNSAQGSSLLQVADGALSQIAEILQRQKAIAQQAGSGTLQNADRAFLDQEFQSLSAEIDRLTDSTTFNGVKLIDGSIAGSLRFYSNTNDGTSGNISANNSIVTISASLPSTGDTVTINGVTVTFTTADPGSANAVGKVSVGSSAANTVLNLANYLNQLGDPHFANLQFVANSNALEVRWTGGLGVSATGGTTANRISVTATASFTSTANTAANTTLSNLTGVDGLSANRYSYTGVITGNIFVNGGTAAQQAGEALNLSGVRNNADFIGRFGTGRMGLITGTYANAQETASFQVVIGDFTYSTTAADIVTAGAVTTLTFTGVDQYGNSGGSFTMKLNGTNLPATTAFDSQAEVDDLVQQINNGLSNVVVQQNRDLLGFTGGGVVTSGGVQVANLTGFSLDFKSDDFSNVRIESVKITAPGVGETDAVIEMVINGEIYRSLSGLGNQIAVNKVIALQNLSDPTKVVALVTGATGLVDATSTSMDLGTQVKADAVAAALAEALHLGDSTAALSFQIGSAATDVLGVSIGAANTTELFGGATLNVLTQDAAAAASAVLDDAIDSVTSLRAGVGALLSRFGYASSTLQVTIQNQDAARSGLLDTDIAAEATMYATSQVKLQAGISVLAQANQQLQSLLKLIG